MALRAVIGHPKFEHLMAILRAPKCHAVGYLETLWHFTGRYTPDGAIGKYSDDQIEAWIGWQGEPGALIAALVKSRWLDVDDTHRLLVHDWHKHADDATRLSLKRQGIAFAVPTVSRQCPDSVPTTSGLPVPEPGAENNTPPLPPQGERREEPIGTGKPVPGVRARGKPPARESLLDYLPPPFHVPSMISAWADYDAHRRARHKPPYTPFGLRKLAALIVDLGMTPDALANCVGEVVMRGWEGIPPDHIRRCASKVPPPIAVREPPGWADVTVASRCVEVAL